MATAAAPQQNPSLDQPRVPAAPRSLIGRLQRDPQKRATLYNDGVLLLSLAYSAVDMVVQWPDLQACQRPVGTWLVGSYMMVASFRLLNYIAQACVPEGEEDRILHIRQPPGVPRVLAYFTWLVLLPGFLYWTVMGSVWVLPLLWHGEDGCLPEGAHPWFVGFCQLLCYFWSLLYLLYFMGILRLEYRLYRAERALRSIETEDSLRRWGRMSLLGGRDEGEAGVQQAAGLAGIAQGLRPTEIAALPKEKLDPRAGPHPLLCGEDCAICISGFSSGDSIRRLPGCQHSFHQECIDLWLLRQAACPLCKCGVDASALL